MQDLLLALQARLRKTIVFITHDLDEALRLGDTIAILRDGEVVQVGHPTDILLQPADDHVRAFVRGVNRARALTVAAAMQPAALVLRDETLGEALAEMQRRGVAVGYLIRGTAFGGVVTKAALLAATAEGKTGGVAGVAVAVLTVMPGASLADALPAALASDIPVPVVGADGALAGVLPSEALAAILGVADQRHVDDRETAAMR